MYFIFFYFTKKIYYLFREIESVSYYLEIVEAGLGIVAVEEVVPETVEEEVAETAVVVVEIVVVVVAEVGLFTKKENK